MGTPAPSPDASSLGGAGVVGALAALCTAVDEAGTSQQVLPRALPILRSVLGDRVALDLRPAGLDGPVGRSNDAGDVGAPLCGGGRQFGLIRATGVDLESAVADAFATAAGRIIGTGLALLQERADVAHVAAHPTPAQAHLLHSAIATIGVAASTLQARGEALPPDVREQLLGDIGESVSTIRDALDEVMAVAGTRDGHHG